jgi:dienelactone hydrolase
MKSFLAILLLTLLAGCLVTPPKFAEGPGGFLYLVGPSKEFSEDSPHVTYAKTNRAGRNIMIYGHGGSGMTDSDKYRAGLFRGYGFDLLYFDAFAMNGIDPTWTNRNLTDEAKQQLIMNVMVGAIKFASSKGYENIVLYGASNGGRAVLLVTSLLEDSVRSQVRLVLSEAPASHGKALPDRVSIPTYFFVGDKDNWGGNSENDLMWTRVNPVSRVTNKDWFDSQSQRGSPVHLFLYQEAGHSFHSGGLRPVQRTMRAGWSTTGYLGASPSAVRQYESDLRRIVAQHTK